MKNDMHSILKRAARCGFVALLSGGLLLAPVTMPAPVSAYVSGQAQADSVGNFFKKLNKPRKQSKKRKNNNKLGSTILKGIAIVGGATVAAGLIKGNAGAIIVGTLLATAPLVIQNEMNKKYGKDQSWAGCLTCNQRRVLVQPGRAVSSKEQRDILAKITADIRDIQTALKTLGFYTMKVDGDYGRGTRKAASLFQKSLMDEPTGKLNAEQRRELFRQADEKGFSAKSEIGITALAPVLVNTVASEPTIKEFKLAESQLQRFTENVLQKGELSEVSDAILLPDGRVEVFYFEGDEEKSSQVGMESIMISTHSLSSSWVNVSLLNEAGSAQVVLNTIDSFSSDDEAADWIEASLKQQSLLSMLTERDSETMLASQSDEATEAQGVAGTIVTQISSAAGPVPAEERKCGQSLYVSFSFPEAYEKINHFNISTPDGAIMTDNGNGSGYLTGSCVQGEYKYTYVVLHHDENKKSWDSELQEGSFQIASLAGQCEINLNDPTKSATLNCF
ncbi:peptidoglycan-binding domain-containing protein [Roseibium sp.]|uniref:peptidoglycan-binding domain-containing protein n=1 Tax=Roseibium sp. TaxID=1936156 RepID=UPI003A97D095